MDRSTLALPGDQDAAHRRGRRGQPPHDRRAQHRRPGADAVAAPRRGRAAGLVPGPAVRRRARRGAVRRQRPRRPAAGHLPGERRSRARRRRRGPSATRASTASSATTRASSSATAGTTSSASGRCSRSATACPTRDFRFGDLRVSADHGGVMASTRVTNTSRRAGSTVAQAYLSFPRSAGEPPRQLKGYEKVRLGAGSAARSSPSASTAPTWPTSTRARTARSSPTAATRCRSAARRATCPRARASSWAATAIAESARPRG